METSDFAKWIEHLKEPLVLAGFAVMLVTGIMRALLTKAKAPSEKVVRQVLMYAFFLGLVVIVVGFILAYKREAVKEVSTPKDQIKQETKGGQSPAVVTNGKAEITYGGTPKEKGDEGAKTEGAGKKDDKTVPSSRSIEQKTGGAQSPAVVSGGDTKIQYDKKK